MTKYIIHYWTYGTLRQDSHKTLQEAIDALKEGEYDGVLSSESITFPSGVVLGKNEIYPLIWGHEKKPSEPITSRLYDKLIYWNQFDQKVLYGITTDEHGREVFNLLSRHDHNAVLVNFQEVNLEA